MGGIALALLLLWWVLRGTDLGVLRLQLRQVSIPGLLAGAALMFCHNVFRILRWRTLLAPVRKEIAFRSLFVAVVLGYTVSFTIPGRLGELVRPAVLSGREQIPIGPCLGSVVTDRLMDILAILLLFSAGALSMSLEGEAANHVKLIRGSSLTLILVLSVPFAILVLMARHRSSIAAWLEGREGILAWVGRSVLAISSGTKALARPRLLALICLYSLMAWIVVAIGGWVAVKACGAEISYASLLVIQPLLVLGIALPTPGGAGGYHAAMTLGLTQFAGVESQLAITTSFLLHLASVLPVTLVGALILLFDRGVLENLRQAMRLVRAMGTEDNEEAANERKREEDCADR